MLKPNAVALRGDANDGAPQTEPLQKSRCLSSAINSCKDYCDNVRCRAAAQRAVSEPSSNAPQPLGDFANQGFVRNRERRFYLVNHPAPHLRRPT